MPFGLRIPSPPSIPTIRLPKLSSFAVLVPNLSLPTLSILGKLSNIKSFFSSVLTPFQQKLKSLTSLGSIQNLSDKAKTAFIDNTLNAVKGFIKNQVSAVLNVALASATAAIGTVKGAIEGVNAALTGISQTFINSFNAVKNAFSKQNKEVSSLIDKEINLIAEEETINLEISSMNADIIKTCKKQISTLSNNEQKELLENPEKKEQYLNSVTDNVVDTSKKNIEQNLKTNYPQQVKTVDKLETLNDKFEYDTIYELSVTALQKTSRIGLLQLLKERMSGFMTIYTNQNFPQLKSIRLAEIARIENDIKNDRNTPKFLYIKNEDYIILK